MAPDASPAAANANPKVQVFHATAPTCWWSWGYEATLNRIRMVYGAQVPIHLLVGSPYDDLDDYLKGYELDGPTAMNDWAREAAELMGVPIHTSYDPARMPRSVTPASRAVVAAHGLAPAEQVERFSRALLRRFIVEAQDVTTPEGIAAAAHEAGLDAKALEAAVADEAAVDHAMEHQGEGVHWPHAPVNFYNLVLADDRGRIVILQNAFDPREVEEAIDFLARGTLTKQAPQGSEDDLAGYLARHGAAPLRELVRVFGLTDAEAEARLAELERSGRAVRQTLAGGAHWAPPATDTTTPKQTPRRLAA